PSLVKFTNFVPYPGTKIHSDASVIGRMNPGKDWKHCVSALGEVSLPFGKRQPLAYVPETSSEWELVRDLTRYNILAMLFPSVLAATLGVKKSIPIFKLNDKWYCRIHEMFRMARTGLNLLSLLIIACIPLRISEPLANRLRPSYQKRIVPELNS
ncbi:MAG TPA: hypothetical protein VJC03_02035, partial [bacterium]|nr:hypothetical protein [bacterium]